MLKKLIAVFAVALIAMTALTTSVGAQTPSEEMNPADIDGLQWGYGRLYAADMESMMDAMSTPGAEMPDMENMVLSGVTMIFKFDNDDNASKGLDQFGDAFAQEMVGTKGDKEEVDDLGDEAVAYTGTTTEEGMDMASSTVFARDGDLIYGAVIVGGKEDDAKAMATDVITFMMDKGVSDSDVELNEDGTSTGGAFDAMPTADDADVIGGLLPSNDADILKGGL